MTIASIIIVGLGVAYSAMGRASQRVVEAQRGVAGTAPPACRPAGDAAPAPEDARRYRCDLPERCEYDTVTHDCREAPPA